MNSLVRVAHATSGADDCLGRKVWVWCPGCHETHSFTIRCAEHGGPSDHSVWEWDGNEESPTFSPSLLVMGSVYRHEDGTQCPDWTKDFETRSHTQGNCHSFVRAGRWEFLGDSAHSLAGQTVEMVPLPDWLTKERN